MRALVSRLMGFSIKVQMAVVGAFVVAATALMGFLPAGALAVESETTKKLGETAGKVGSEGVEIVLIILSALTALIVAVIIIPKAVGLIKRFI